MYVGSLQTSVMELIGKNNSPFKRQPHKMVKHIQTIRWLVIFFAVIYFDQNGLKFENFAVNQFLFPLIKLSLRFACLYAELIVNDFSYNFQAGNYMFKVNNRNARTKVCNMFKVNNEDTKNDADAIGVVLVSLLLTLNIFHMFVPMFLLLTLSR